MSNCAINFILLSQSYRKIQDNLKNTSQKLSDCADIKNKECSPLIKKYIDLLYRRDKVEKELIQNQMKCGSQFKND